jgi:hypothetical protein
MPRTGYWRPNYSFPRTDFGARSRVSKKPLKTPLGRLSTSRPRAPTSIAYYKCVAQAEGTEIVRRELDLR